MPVASEPIRIEGLRELQKSLRTMDGESQKKLRLVFNEAAKVVYEGAAQRVAKRSGRARASLKAQSSQREARVVGGGARAPYYPWLDFGGAVGRNNSVRRPFLKDGRYIYATYNNRRDWVRERIERGLEELIRESGLEPS